VELKVDFLISRSIMFGGLLPSYFISLHRVMLTCKWDTTIVTGKYCVNVWTGLN
jgi:hypothetical protein